MVPSLGCRGPEYRGRDWAQSRCTRPFASLELRQQEPLISLAKGPVTVSSHTALHDLLQCHGFYTTLRAIP